MYGYIAVDPQLMALFIIVCRTQLEEYKIMDGTDLFIFFVSLT